ncbi:branched-chain amino acid ABC transporter ATP-binding protein/permease [Pollutimonas bauzanensis]|uniref:Branched-chain amino acid transport system permease protein n=1 Tax=Pollutimonas bauzanensis TaxID=658167 RepID=A0A1M5QK39_9BURK|nr:ATP-binding cassette domain-containing protein [Pollutimonas bauzanensis]SHH14457.1 branched-chain amino acid transport system permease protein [Pollutimonas bauzanensis]
MTIQQVDEIADEGRNWQARCARRQLRVAGCVVAIFLALAAIPLVSGGSFDLGRYEVAIAYIVVAIGMNIAFGYCGELILGYPTIMAVSAYTAGMLSAHKGWGVAATFPCAILAGTAAGLLIMGSGLRVRGWYLALITLFSVVVMPQLIVLGETWTGGEYGLTGILPIQFGGEPLSDGAMFELSLAILALVLLAVWNFLRSGWGTRLRALRDAPSGARAVGLNPLKLRLTVYIMSSIPAAVAGFYLAYAEQFISPDAFGMSLTLLLLTGVVLGGAGTLFGPIVGMVPLLALSFWVGPFSPFNAITLGLGLLIGTLVFPDGLIPSIGRLFKRGSIKKDTAAGSAADMHVPQDSHRSGQVTQLESAYATEQKMVVRIEDISVRFGAHQVLSGVTLTLKQGALTGLVGPNGSGKSTLLNAISGFIQPQQGRIFIGDKDLSGKAVHELALSGIGRTFQIPQLIEDATALENISLGLLGQRPGRILASIFRLPRLVQQGNDDLHRSLAMLAEVGLPASAISTPVAELPLGLKRIVEIGRAVVAEPTLLLLDEPAAGLNDEERLQLGHLLNNLKKRGITILVVEHNVPFVMQFCDDLALLEAGQISCHAATSAALPATLLDYLNHAPEQSKCA